MTEHTLIFKLLVFSNIVLALSFAMSSAAAAEEKADVALGKARSAVCHACHGQQGITTNPSWPNLAGQNRGYLELALKAYRDGKRTDPIMSPMAAPLSDQDIRNLAAHYARLGSK